MANNFTYTHCIDSYFDSKTVTENTIFAFNFDITTHQEVTIVKMGRTFLGQKFLQAYAFIYKDTLVDTGLDCCGKNLRELAGKQKVQKIFLSHHHEDHSGGAHHFDIPIFSSTKTAQIIHSGFKLKPYQRIVWGKMHKCDCKEFPVHLAMGDETVEVIHTPGHSEDHVVFFLPQKKWLFCGDLFVHEKIKYFRKDEDFATTIASLRRVIALDFSTLFCCHRGVVVNGKKALCNKLDHLLRVEDKVRKLHEQGLPIKKIAQKLTKTTSLRITLGDVSTDNLVHSILFGGVRRPDIKKILEKGHLD
ncbi:MBL fold metallo-hydrolase [Candidatus Uabimicrobium amorphum]|uniref:MBL fold hydrolase n=1 Tax=Uabimicrobium amorphum TaxID=2596890 RepID=A0A5S9IMQ5_UABAM|nr:MBL fold metallo-hydrolase [Candidatus Uabimicrobium amorphum]BBM83395.1 MBL fold hydrolase [Candidatus Uabimicrobium amorphum]